MNARPEIDEEEQPLDPATENVRRKLARFGAVFMGLNMLALMAVLAAIVYKIGGFGEEEAPQEIVGASAPIDPGFEAMVDIPDGARLISAAETGGRVTLSLELADGSNEVWIYEIGSAAVIGKLRLK